MRISLMPDLLSGHAGAYRKRLVTAWSVRRMIARNEKKSFLYGKKITLFILFPAPENRFVQSIRRTLRRRFRAKRSLFG
ncbi:hypothetical protein [Paraburkholderia sp. J12]|uniref:hypothetical protein n=1 Tax=Paraburkholderia sp. J12 TaxID=2805432 RepID=UPI002ABD9CB2|nr:hypothetical protein [Paraburkholderia sp. J12]